MEEELNEQQEQELVQDYVTQEVFKDAVDKLTGAIANIKLNVPEGGGQASPAIDFEKEYFSNLGGK